MAERKTEHKWSPKAQKAYNEAETYTRNVQDYIPDFTARELFRILLAQKIVTHTNPYLTFITSSQALMSKFKSQEKQPVIDELETKKNELATQLIETTGDPNAVYILVGNLRMFANEFYPVRYSISGYVALKKSWADRLKMQLTTPVSAPQ